MQTKTLIAGVIACAAVFTLGQQVAYSAAPQSTIYGCLKGGNLTQVQKTAPKCKPGTAPISWQAQGIQGLPGKDGAAGAAGVRGETGPAGPAGASSGAFWITDSAGQKLYVYDQTMQRAYVDGRWLFAYIDAPVIGEFHSWDPSGQPQITIDDGFDGSTSRQSAPYVSELLFQNSDCTGETYQAPPINPFSLDPADQSILGYVTPAGGASPFLNFNSVLYLSGDLHHYAVKSMRDGDGNCVAVDPKGVIPILRKATVHPLSEFLASEYHHATIRIPNGKIVYVP